MPFKLLAYDRLRKGGEVAAELPATLARHRRWIAIYPVLGDDRQHFKAFQVLDFELDEDDLSDFFSTDLRKNQQKLNMPNEAELYAYLEVKGIEPSVFDAPWHCDFPAE